MAGAASTVIQSAKQAPTVAPVQDDEQTYDQKIESVKKLKELLDTGILTPEEFDAKKKEILGL